MNVIDNDKLEASGVVLIERLQKMLNEYTSQTLKEFDGWTLTINVKLNKPNIEGV